MSASSTNPPSPHPPSGKTAPSPPHSHTTPSSEAKHVGDQHAHDHEHDHHHHDHTHTEEEHGRPHARDDEDSLSYYRLMEMAVRELLIQKGILDSASIRAAIEAMDSRSYHRGAQMVARAWVDSGYRERMLENGAVAAMELGLDVGPLKLVVVENTPSTHNVIVCTLCSCYPRMLLGIPPDWYKSRAYRSRVVREPRAVLADFGTHLPEGIVIRVHDSTADMRYMVLPMRPPGSEGKDETSLASLVSRDSLIGTAIIDRA